MEFRILGPLEVRGEHGTIDIPGAKRRALLALLLLHANEVVSTDRLMDELWPGEPPGSGVTALQVSVSKLRKALGPAAAALETRAPGYVLRLGPEELDLFRFERLVGEADAAEPDRAAAKLREALGLWRGPPLHEFTYASFAQAAIARLEALRLAALEKRVEAELALGRHADLVAELEALVVEHPLRERLRGQLILALYRCGRQADALAVYQSTRRTLVDSLGIDPSPALQELERAVLRQDPALELAQPPAPSRSILVAPRSEGALETLLELAEQLARRPEKEIVVTRPVAREEELAAAASELSTCRERLVSRGVSARAAGFVSGTPAADVVRLAVEQDVDLVLVEGSAALLDDPFVRALLDDAPCDVAAVVGAFVRPASVLVPFVGAEHDWAAIEVAAWIAGALESPLVLAGPRDGPGGRDASRLLASASLVVQRALGIDATPLLVDAGEEGLVRAAAASNGLVVVGLAERWRTLGLGTARQALLFQSEVPVVVVRHGLRPGGLAPNASLTRFTWSLKA